MKKAYLIHAIVIIAMGMQLTCKNGAHGGEAEIVQPGIPGGSTLIFEIELVGIA